MVVVLDEIAGPCADDIQRVGQDGGGILLADQRRKLGLVLLVVLELLRQSNCILQRKLAGTSYLCTHIHGGRVVMVAGRRGGKVGAKEKVIPLRLRAKHAGNYGLCVLVCEVNNR